MARPLGVNPRLAKTDNEELTIPPSPVTVTRTHSPQTVGLVRYHIEGDLGAGAYGTVYRAVNVDTGKLMAVKRLRLPATQRRNRLMLEREIETLSRLRHVSVPLPSVLVVAYLSLTKE